MSQCYVDEVNGGAAIVETIAKATDDSVTYHFGELLDLPQTQQLAGGPDQASLELLKIFAYGTLNDYSASDASAITLTTGQKLKLQRLTLATLCGNQQVVQYSTLMSELCVSNVRQLEDLVIDAIYEGLVQGKLCQLEQTFEVASATGRDVRDEDIDTMINLLGAWNQKSVELLTTIQDNIQSAQAAGTEKKAAAEEFEKKKEETKETVAAQIKSGEKTAGGGMMNQMFGGGGSYMSGRPGKTKGRR